ncbi:MAG: tyrosine-type recombinase/integrase [Patescibacteria group bacterium]
MKKTKSNIPIIKQISDFLIYCKNEKGLSQKTQENYQRYLQKFILWLKRSKKESLLPHQLTADDIWAFRLYLSRFKSKNGQPLKKLTQNYYLIALRSLLGFFTAKDLESTPADKIQLPKAAEAEKTIKFLNLDQIEKLLMAADQKTKEGLRDRAILESLFSTGLRIAELVALNREQFANIRTMPRSARQNLDSSQSSELKDRKDIELGIVGKGQNPRTVYFSERALGWIKKYLETREDKEKPLFIHYVARKDSEPRLTARSVERIVKKYALLSGVPFFTTPHTLRHSYATDLLNQGVDIRTIQEFLGHRSITSTQIYTHVTNKRLRDVHRQYHSFGKDSKK